MSLTPKAAFDPVTATEYNELLALVAVLTGFSQSGAAAASGSLTLTTSLQDVPGATFNATTTGANAFAMVTVNVQFAVTVLGAGVTLAGALLVDGVNQAANGTCRDSADQVHDGHRSFTWKVPLPVAGVHTFKLQGSKSGAGSTSSISNTAGTNIVVNIYDVP